MMKIEVPDGLSVADIEFLQAMAQGVLNARKKYPGPNGRFVAFAAEFGEALHEVQKIITGRGTVKDLGAELRQAAGMAMRFAVEGDPMEFPPEVQQEFPCIVSPEPDMKPHQPGDMRLGASLAHSGSGCVSDFLLGAQMTAHRMDRDFLVRDDRTGKGVYGVGIIMNRLIREVESARAVLHRISLMVCRCIDNGQPCSGCTKAGREAPRIAHQFLSGKSSTESKP